MATPTDTQLDEVIAKHGDNMSLETKALFDLGVAMAEMQRDEALLAKPKYGRALIEEMPISEFKRRLSLGGLECVATCNGDTLIRKVESGDAHRAQVKAEREAKRERDQLHAESVRKQGEINRANGYRHYPHVALDDEWMLSYEWADKSVHPINWFHHGFVTEPPEIIKDALVDLAYKAKREPDDVDGDDRD